MEQKSTNEPNQIIEPEPAEKPEPTLALGPTKKPEPTEKPEPTQAPEPTAASKPMVAARFYYAHHTVSKSGTHEDIIVDIEWIAATQIIRSFPFGDNLTWYDEDYFIIGSDSIIIKKTLFKTYQLEFIRFNLCLILIQPTY